MREGCEVCTTQGSWRNPLIVLEELGMSDGEHEANHIRLCRSCLGQREVMSWSLKREIGHEVERALEQHPETHGRFSYWSDGAAIHLVRLQSRWVARHVAPLAVA